MPRDRAVLLSITDRTYEYTSTSVHRKIIKLVKNNLCKQAPSYFFPNLLLFITIFMNSQDVNDVHGFRLGFAFI